MLQVAAHDTEIHCPTTIRDAVMLVRARPTLVPELYPGLVIAFFEVDADARASPVTVGVHELELEVGVRDASGDARAPIVAGPEP